MESGRGPWHSVNSGIYHDNPGCQTGNSIAPGNVRPGTGDGRLCDECARLNAAAAPPVTGPAAAPAADPSGARDRGGREEGPPPPATAATAGSRAASEAHHLPNPGCAGSAFRAWGTDRKKRPASRRPSAAAPGGRWTRRTKRSPEAVACTAAR